MEHLENRYQCIVDLTQLRDKQRLILHLPRNIYARLSKTSAQDDTSEEVHVFLGRKRSSKTGEQQEVSGGGGFTIYQQCSVTTNLDVAAEEQSCAPPHTPSLPRTYGGKSSRDSSPHQPLT